MMENPSTREGPLVLVVHNDNEVRNSLKFLLEVEGFVVKIYDDARALLDDAELPRHGGLVVDYNLPGLNGYLEMQRLQKAGMSLTQILRAATINNAREFKLDSQVGTIEQGKIANLVLLKKSPLESVAAYDSVTTVFVHGKPIARNSLAADANR